MTDHAAAPTAADLYRAQRGAFAELEWWLAAALRLLALKLPDDPDAQMLARLCRTLHMDRRLHEVSAAELLALLAYNRGEAAPLARAGSEADHA